MTWASPTTARRAATIDSRRVSTDSSTAGITMAFMVVPFGTHHRRKVCRRATVRSPLRTLFEAFPTPHVDHAAARLLSTWLEPFDPGRRLSMNDSARRPKVGLFVTCLVDL